MPSTATRHELLGRVSALIGLANRLGTESQTADARDVATVSCLMLREAETWLVETPASDAAALLVIEAGLVAQERVLADLSASR